MRFLCDIRLPDPALWAVTEGTRMKSLTVPTQIIKEAVEREAGKVVLLDGCNGGWDCFCIFECQTPEAQVRICMTLHTAGFTTKTRTTIPGTELDKAWENAVQHPVTAGR